MNTPEQDTGDVPVDPTVGEEDLFKPQDETPNGGDMTKEVKAEEVTAEQMAAETAEKGNHILPLSAEQKQAYDNEVSEVKDRIAQAGRSALIARWYIGRAVLKLQDDVAKNGGKSYGSATIDGFAIDIGMGRSTVFKCRKVAESFTLSEVKKLNLPVDGVDTILSAPQAVQKQVVSSLIESAEKESDFRPTVQDVRSMVGSAVDKHSEAVAGAGGQDKKGKAQKSVSQFGTNSSTGTNHKQVLGRFIKAVENVEGTAANVLISLKEIPKDTDVTDKAEVTLLQMQEDAHNEVKALIKSLGAIEESFSKAKAARGAKEREISKAEKEAEKQKAAEDKAKERERARKAAEKKAAAAKKPAAKKSAAKKKAPTRRSTGPKVPGTALAGKT